MTGQTTETLDYLGTTDAVVRIGGGPSPVDAALDPAGVRLATREGGTASHLLPDLHGNAAALWGTSTDVVTDAFRYDPYGEELASVSSSTIRTPWRFQGRMLEGASGDPELYDFGFRSYAADLGAFASLDNVAGSAQDPLSLNRFLYAAANPESMSDPTGHCAMAATAPQDPIGYALTGVCVAAAGAAAVAIAPEVAAVAIGAAVVSVLVVATVAVVDAVANPRPATLAPQHGPYAVPQPYPGHAPPPNVSEFAKDPTDRLERPRRFDQERDAWRQEEIRRANRPGGDQGPDWNPRFSCFQSMGTRTLCGGIGATIIATAVLCGVDMDGCVKIRQELAQPSASPRPTKPTVSPIVKPTPRPTPWTLPGANQQGSRSKPRIVASPAYHGQQRIAL